MCFLQRSRRLHIKRNPVIIREGVNIMKKNMRKVAALGLCVALGATMLTACGGSKGKSASGGKTELNFGIWDENQRPAMEKMVKAYEKENSDVKINIQLTPYKGGEYWTKLEAAASGGKAPDVFWLNVLHLDSYVEGGILDDLTDKIKDSDIKDSYSETLVITMSVIRRTMLCRKILILMQCGITKKSLTSAEFHTLQMI